MHVWRRLPGALVAALLAVGCDEKSPSVSVTPRVERCELDWAASPPWASEQGEGARAGRAQADGPRVDGPFAFGEEGDFWLENERLRVVVGKPGRKLAHNPFGGNLIDADLRRAAGEPGRDGLAELGFLYAFGRTLDVERVEVVRDGSAGGAAVLAATGRDALNDYVTLQQTLDAQVPGVKLVIPPDEPLPIRGTHWYLVSPGESRVRVVTTLCNDGDTPLNLPVGEVWQGGGKMDLFNPSQCEGGFGEAGCLVDPAPWVGWNGEGVAYGLRAYDFADVSKVSTAAAVYLTGSVATLAGGRDLQGVLRWVDPAASERPGALTLPAHGQRVYVRDFVVGRDLAEVAATWRVLDGEPLGDVRVRTVAEGAPVPARVRVESQAQGRLWTLALTDASGESTLRLPPGDWTLSAAAAGHSFSPGVPVTVTTGETLPVVLELGPSRTLHVRVRDPFGAPLPAKVVVRCASGACVPLPRDHRRFTDAEPQPDDIAAIEFLPVDGEAALRLPPGRYDVLVSRGPEYSLFPDTAPKLGAPVDLTTHDGAVDAVLARVVDTPGWMSADLHVHAVNSADSSAPNAQRVLAFLAEGVETLVSTDHDFVTDFAPFVQALGAQAHLATVRGEEISPDFGHVNVFPFPLGRGLNGGALDWAGGVGPTFRVGQIFEEARRQSPLAVLQVNHPRGDQGLFSRMGLDTLTGATHADPAAFRMAPARDAHEGDSKLFSFDFDALELQNGPSASLPTLNDWMTFLSRGVLRTGTAVSDSHGATSAAVGYGRTWVELDTDEPLAFDETVFAARLKALRAVGSNGPFLQLSAQKLDANGAPLGDPVGVGGTVHSSASQKIRLTVTVQAPEWMRFDRLELYTHAEGREAFAGEPNGTWPSSRIAQSRSLDPANLPIEAVPGLPGQTFRRIRLQEHFDVEPRHDAWYVVMLRSSAAAGTLFPLQFRPSCNDAGCTVSSARPFAFTNPVFVDADGSGAYDEFPLKVTQGLMAPRRPPLPLRRWVPSEAEAQARFRAYRRLHEH